jgi:hypothetical protein
MFATMSSSETVVCESLPGEVPGESSCIGVVSVSPDSAGAWLRVRPGVSSESITILPSGTTVILRDGYYDDWEWWWWRVTVLNDPDLEGYIRSDLISNTNDCERIEVEPPPEPPRSNPGMCVYEVPEGSSKQVWSVSLGRNQAPSHTLTGGTQFNVYGRSVDSEGNYLLLITDPHMESAEWRWVRMFDGIALNNKSEQRRACDYAVLAAFPFLDGTDGGSGQESPQYKNALLYYMDHFAPPILNASYEWHFNSQLFGGHHNGVDIVDRRPVADKLQAPFRVVAPHMNGVIVDAGPDAFIQTSKVRGHFANISQIQPKWLADCRTTFWSDQTRYTGSCGRDGLWVSVTPRDGGGVDVFVMFAMTAHHMNMPHEFRNDGWQASEAGLDSDEVRLTVQHPGYASRIIDNVQYGTLCHPCTLTIEGDPMPGRQIVVQYDVNGDTNANIEVVYLHVQPNPDYYESWNTECSVRNSPRHTAWPSSRASSNCLVGSATILGEVVNIGFTNGSAFGTEHLHYTVYIDWNDDGIFLGEKLSLIDPLIATEMIR